MWSVLRANGVMVPDWDESNIWLVHPDRFEEVFEELWGKRIADSPYLVDLSTLTHLTCVDIPAVLAGYGYEPHYIVCQREPADRWVSAFLHMSGKATDHRGARAYIDFYSRFAGLEVRDLLLLEQDLISRDLRTGKKSASGLLTPDYFKQRYPVSFECSTNQVDYQFRYFGESVDMLENIPTPCSRLQLEDWESTRRWITRTFDIGQQVISVPAANTSAVNALLHRPLLQRIGGLLPRQLRRGGRALLEAAWRPGTLRAPLDTGIENALREMVRGMLPAYCKPIGNPPEGKEEPR